MANPEHVATFAKGVTAWNAWRRSRPKVAPDLSGANLSVSELRGVNLRLADLERVQMPPANLEKADLSDANLRGANLNEARFLRGDLRRANFSKASVRNGAFCETDVRGANFTGADLSGSNFENLFHMDGALFAGANLADTSLRDANLYRTNLEEASLLRADLTDSYLHNANLARANIAGADFTGARLDGANLSGALANHTVFEDNDLSGTVGLEDVQHEGPSTVGIATIYRSKGNIPELFLRGAGVPDDFITYMKSLAGTAIQFYSCFISYSTKDQAFADRLHADLQSKRVRCWLAPHDVQGGRKLHEQIDEAIRLHDKLLLILSPHSMESEWVKTEIAKARKREVRDQRRVLFPIRLAPFETLRD
jgi:uncharacterized protein YjbI with pentapeptide repeats